MYEMGSLSLSGKTVLITGAARRVGRLFALGCAHAGADVIIHHGHSPAEAETTRQEIEAIGRRAWVLVADLNQPAEAARVISEANQRSPLFALVNSAAIFEPLSVAETTLPDWEHHLNINLTAPFLLCQAFAAQLPQSAEGRIVNILDWRAQQPGADHFPYTVSKAALASMTQALAVALAPRITVNGLALGAVLPPTDGGGGSEVTAKIPLGRWSEAKEVQQALVFLLAGPAYITGEVLHLDGGRHLV
ncbi:MAG: SDR family oxidoreductase [Anaerolineales bacterium]|jgi:NAD(P)-dependent dehydrogenase (short-subunit alcohol dehydrogenase family)